MLTLRKEYYKSFCDCHIQHSSGQDIFFYKNDDIALASNSGASGMPWSHIYQLKRMQERSHCGTCHVGVEIFLVHFRYQSKPKAWDQEEHGRLSVLHDVQCNCYIAVSAKARCHFFAKDLCTEQNAETDACARMTMTTEWIQEGCLNFNPLLHQTCLGMYAVCA